MAMSRKAPKIDDPHLIEQLLQELQRGSMSWADSCRFLRASLGMTQQEFAAKTGVAIKIVKELESEGGNPTLASLNRIAESFGMKVGFVKPSGRSVSIGTDAIVRERRDERLASLRDLKRGKTTLKELHAKNSIRGSDFKLGLPKLS